MSKQTYVLHFFRNHPDLDDQDLNEIEFLQSLTPRPLIKCMKRQRVLQKQWHLKQHIKDVHQDAKYNYQVCNFNTKKKVKPDKTY